jgi:hypothetical protein
MKEAYRTSHAQAQNNPSLVPPGVSAHEYGLYGALYSRYQVSGAIKSIVMTPERVWAELLPFRCLPEKYWAVEALAEYVVYKEGAYGGEVRLPELMLAVKRGLELAERQGHAAAIEAAKKEQLFGWVHLLEAEGMFRDFGMIE